MPVANDCPGASLSTVRAHSATLIVFSKDVEVVYDIAHETAGPWSALKMGLVGLVRLLERYCGNDRHHPGLVSRLLFGSSIVCTFAVYCPSTYVQSQSFLVCDDVAALVANSGITW